MSFLDSGPSASARNHRASREGARVHQGPVSLHAIGDGPVLPLTDAQYEKQFMKTVVFAPIHTIWGHPAGAGANPEDKAFLNTTIAKFLTNRSAR